MTTKGMKIGILTAGGDCPGINAAIRGVAKTAIISHDMKVYGISSGFLGLIEREYDKLSESDVSGILTLGGTILGTSREKPFKEGESYRKAIDKPHIIVENYKKMELDCLVCIGGNGTMKSAHKLSQEGINIVGIPKTIDNDVWGTDFTFGFDSAVSIATEAIDRLHTTANSHKRIMVIEVMGHQAGWLALYSGIAGGGDIILIPEIAYDINVIEEYLKKRIAKNKGYSIIVVAEGIETENNKSPGSYIAKTVTKLTGLETRETALGYLQRGGTPTATDRILVTRYGAYATELIAKREFGRMVSLKKDEITSIPLGETAGKLKLVDPGHYLIKKARNLGTCFGDE
jgi:phosphofructokinase-like protein